MNRSRWISGSLGVLGASLFLAVATFAEEGSGSGDHLATLIFKWVHFALVVVLAYWVFGKILPPIFRRKADHISAAIEKATRAKADAEQRLKEVAAKMVNLEREVETFRVQAQRDAEAELERLRGSAQLDLEKIRAAARAEIEAAERAAHIELKELAAKLAVDGAESLVARQMTPAVQEAMINHFVESLQGRPN